MDRAEYMRLKGEQAVASEALNEARKAIQRTHCDLQSFVNRAQVRPLSERDAEAGAALVRALFEAQKMEAYCRAQVEHFRKCLDGVSPPAI